MAGNTWYKLGDTANDQTGDLYYRGQRIREAYYRGEQIWGEEFLGILLAHLPDKLHYPGADTLVGIDIARLPDKTEYEHGEEFDYSGAIITASYADGSAVDVTSQCEFTPATEMLSSNVSLHMGSNSHPDEALDYTGIKVLGVWSHGRMEDISAQCEFTPEEGTIIDKSTVLIGIIATQLPNKTTYTAGESFDYSGVSISAIYADGHVVDITSECVFNPSSGRGVKPAYMTGILVTKLPNKTTYISGEEIDFDGIKVIAVYSNGIVANVTNNCKFIY